MTAVVALTTVAKIEDAESLARSLVEKRLAACVNIVSNIRSIYRWEGSVASDAEHLLLIKTTNERVAEVREAILSNHPYEVPEFVVIPIAEMSPAYGTWLGDSVAI